MYGGVINRQVVYCCHPVVVMGKTGVAASFADLNEALKFLMSRGFKSGAVYRHSGSDWDKVDYSPLQILDAVCPPKSGPTTHS